MFLFYTDIFKNKYNHNLSLNLKNTKINDFNVVKINIMFLVHYNDLNFLHSDEITHAQRSPA